MDGWNTTFLLGRPIFRGYVSFREGTLNRFKIVEKYAKSEGKPSFFLVGTAVFKVGSLNMSGLPKHSMYGILYLPTFGSFFMVKCR